MASSLLKWSLLPVVFALLVGYLLHAHTTPAFDPAVLRGVAAAARERFPPDGSQATLHSTVTFVADELARLYPKHIHGRPTDPWITNLAGGFKTAMLILHASTTEYVMIWGSQVATTGHSGRNLAEFNDWILSGSGTWWKEGALTTVTAAASNASSTYVHTPYLQGGIVQLEAGTFMLELCRGVIPALLPFGLGDALFSSMDLITIGKSLYAYGRLTVKELIENGKF